MQKLESLAVRAGKSLDMTSLSRRGEGLILEVFRGRGDARWSALGTGRWEQEQLWDGSLGPRGGDRPQGRASGLWGPEKGVPTEPAFSLRGLGQASFLHHPGRRVSAGPRSQRSGLGWREVCFRTFAMDPVVRAHSSSR